MIAYNDTVKYCNLINPCKHYRLYHIEPGSFITSLNKLKLSLKFSLVIRMGCILKRSC